MSYQRDLDEAVRGFKITVIIIWTIIILGVMVWPWPNRKYQLVEFVAFGVLWAAMVLTVYSSEIYQRIKDSFANVD